MSASSDIERMIDEALESGEPPRGYDFGDPTYPKCPHCDRDFHGLPITQKIVEMYDWGHYNEEYSYAKDTTPVLCQGSDFIGPMPSEKPVFDKLADYFLPPWARYVFASGRGYSVAADATPVLINDDDEEDQDVRDTLDALNTSGWYAASQLTEEYMEGLGMLATEEDATEWVVTTGQNEEDE